MVRAQQKPPAAIRFGALALGAVALGAFAIGALAVGSLAVGRLAVHRARIRRLEIDELVIGRVRRGQREFRDSGESSGSGHVRHPEARAQRASKDDGR
jgi:hypothetical protein